jgi:Putative lumazine-binding
MENNSKGVSLARLNSPRAVPLVDPGVCDILLLSMGTQEKRPGETLESWKQIAAHLNRSERTVRRWEAVEGLPVRRREHQKQDTVFAYSQEIDEWSRRRTRKQLLAAQSEPDPKSHRSILALSDGVGAESPLRNGYLAEHDTIAATVDLYIAGGRAGQGDVMRPAFHPEATIAGYCFGIEYCGSIEHLFRWINENGPAPNIEPRFARIELFETIAIVHLEVQGWSEKLAGPDARISEVFTLLKRDGEWLITQKTFHWHDS